VLEFSTSGSRDIYTHVHSERYEAKGLSLRSGIMIASFRGIRARVAGVTNDREWPGFGFGAVWVVLCWG